MQVAKTDACTPNKFLRGNTVSINNRTPTTTTSMIWISFLMKMMINMISNKKSSKLKMTLMLKKMLISIITRVSMLTMMLGRNISVRKLEHISNQKTSARGFTKSWKKGNHLKWNCMGNICWGISLDHRCWPRLHTQQIGQQTCNIISKVSNQKENQLPQYQTPELVPWSSNSSNKDNSSSMKRPVPISRIRLLQSSTRWCSRNNPTENTKW